MCTTDLRQRRRCGVAACQRGFTLPELIVFIVVVGVGLAGILLVMNTAVRGSADPLVRKQTLAVAESLLEEILLKSYDDPDGLPNVVEASRALWDDVSDYAGYTTSGGMQDMAGNAIAGLASYNVTGVTVTDVTLAGVPARRVTVTVTGPGGPLSLSGYRTNY
jgi:MSHA pilin protein MshD